MTALLLLVFLGMAEAPIQSASLVGSAKDTGGHAVHEGTALLVELKRVVKIGEDGSFRFDNLPSGTFRLKVTSRDHGSILEQVVLKEGEETKVSIEFDITIHEHLTISAAPIAKSISDVSQAVGVVNEDELFQKMQPTLGETLASEPGVSSTYFGPGASRPVIRGLGGDRIRILEAGVETGDVSSTSADHALSVDTATADRVEILRGPASLRYGSSAVGGVINVLDNRIPEIVPTENLAGQLEMRGNTAAEERAFNFRADGGQGRFAWHADYSSLETDDVEIPESPEHEEDHDEHEGEEEHEEEPFMGVLENSAIDSKKGSVGASFITDRGFLGVSVIDSQSLYGVPGHAHAHGHDEEHEEHEEGEHEEGEHEEEEALVNIDMEQTRFDLRGGFRPDGLFQAVNFRLGTNDYEHVELEGDEVGTIFTNEYHEIRAEAVHGQIGSLTSGSFGVQVSSRDFAAVGAEAFVPANETDRLAAFVFEEMQKTSYSISFGVRLERQTNKAEAFAPHEHHEEEHEEEGEHHEEEEEEHEEAQSYDLSFSGFSAALGYVYGLDKDYAVAVSLTTTQRAPTPEELFSNGPHLATSAFEVGDPDLDTESSLGLDLVLRKKTGLVTGEISFFHNDFSDYIYQQFTGDEEDGLREFQFVQGDATFEGAEIHGDITLLHTEPHHVHAEISYDFVRAELDGGSSLPRITPNRLMLGLEYKSPHFWSGFNIRLTEDQKNVAELEEPTDGYTMLDANVGYRFIYGQTVHMLLLRGTNLTDQAARAHTSFLRDRTLLPGRNISLAYRLNF